MQKDGIHIAFAAGTGALCFVDLVAYVIHTVVSIRGRNSSVNNDAFMAETASGDIDMESV